MSHVPTGAAARAMPFHDYFKLWERAEILATISHIYHERVKAEVRAEREAKRRNELIDCGKQVAK